MISQQRSGLLPPGEVHEVGPSHRVTDGPGSVTLAERPATGAGALDPSAMITGFLPIGTCAGHYAPGHR